MTAAFDKPNGLSADQENLIWHTAREFYLATADITDPFERRQEIRRRSRKKLGSILTSILLSIAIQLITKLIVKWIENHVINPPSEPPQGFASSLEAI